MAVTQEDINQAHADDEAGDRERFGGPVTDGMVMTMLRAHYRARDVRNFIPYQEFDCAAIAREINSWLTPVGN